MKPKTQEQLVLELEDLRARLDEAEDTLLAIRSGEVDALVVSGAGGEHVYTLKGADHAYRMLIEEMSEGALTLTAEGLILYANMSFGGMLNTPIEKVIGSTIDAWVAPDSQQNLQSLLRKGESEKRRQLVLVAGDGTLRIVSVSATDLQKEDLPGLLCLVVTDLTEQKRTETIAASEKLAQELLAASDQSRVTLLSVLEDEKLAEQALKSKEEQYRTLVEGMNEGLIQVDNDDVILFVNQQFCQISGYSRGELIGKVGNELLFDPADREVIRRKNQDRLEGKSDSYEIRLRCQDGQERWVYVSGTPVTGPDGMVIGSIGTFTDIMARKQAEDKIKNQLAELLRWQATMLDREDRVMELKREVNEILARQGQPKKYGNG